MKIFYTIQHVTSYSSSGKVEFDERVFYQEKSFSDYQRYIERNSDPYFMSGVNENNWCISVSEKRLFERYGMPVKESEFPAWYLEGCTRDSHLAEWELVPLDIDVVRLDFFKNHAVEFLFLHDII